LPFEKLVEELQPERDTSRTPLFQVMFVLQNTAARGGGGERDRSSSMTAREQGVSDSTAKFDLTLEAFPAGDRVGCGLEYNTDLFDASTVERMAEHFVSLLGGIVGDPEQKVGALPMLCDRERTRLLYEYNATEADYPREAPIHRLFEEQAARTPDATAVTFEDLTVTYRELDDWNTPPRWSWPYSACSRPGALTSRSTRSTRGSACASCWRTRPSGCLSRRSLWRASCREYRQRSSS
jgi:non-ribosomal peptide synthetase component F